MSRFKLVTDDKSPTLMCTNISKRYVTAASNLSVLDNFSFELYPGKVTLLMGPSGCGKTTLLMIAGGLLAPDSGQCSVCGHDLAVMSPPEKVEFRRQHIGFLFQQLHLFPALSALENVALPLLIDGIPAARAYVKARQLMQQLGLEMHRHTPLDSLSGGQKQRIAMGRALIRAPRLIICDEPTSNLDAATARMMFSLIHDYVNTTNCAFLISTHDPQLPHYADQVLQFKDWNHHQHFYQRES